MPKLRNLKHEAFTRKYARGLVQSTAPSSATAVYSEVYHCQPDSARASAARLLAIVSVRTRVYELIGGKEHRPEELAVDLVKLREAKRGVYYKGKKVAEEPDNTARLQAVGLSLRAQEVFTPTNQSAGDADALNLRLTPEMIERLEKIVPMMHDLRKRAPCPRCGFIPAQTLDVTGQHLTSNSRAMGGVCDGPPG